MDINTDMMKLSFNTDTGYDYDIDNSDESSDDITESFISKKDKDDECIKMDTSICPSELYVNSHNKIELYNPNVVKVPGANPIIFNNLEEYIEYMKWQRSRNVKCPLLELKQAYNTQGDLIETSENLQLSDNLIYREKLNDEYDTLLIDANVQHPPYNNNSFPGFDPTTFYNGLHTPLDINNINVQK
jgi:hypothetical protein